MIVRIVRSAVAALALISTAAVVTQAQETNGFGASAGLVLPSGGGDMGFTIGGQYSMPWKDAIGLRFNADYSRWDVGLGNLSVLSGMANAVYSLNSSSALKPYLLAGLGLGNTSVDLGPWGSTSDMDLAFNVGAGYNFEMGSRRLFAEVRYMSVGGGDYLPIVIGLRF